MTVGGGDRLEPGERGFISDTRAGALVAADGTIDWWCPGAYDADPCFTRLLDPAGACLRIGPATPGRPPVGVQAVRPGTVVLVTTLPGRECLVEITDFLPWDGTAPPGRVVRLVTVLRGPADIELDLVPGRPGGGPAREVSPWSEGVAFDGVVLRWGRPVELVSQPPPAPGPRTRRLVARATVRLDTGERLVVTLDGARSTAAPLSPDRAAALAERTSTAWRRIHGAVEAAGPYADQVAGAALLVRALAGRDGAPVAAPVTSLPRVVGGERQDDGRVVHPVTVAAWARAAAGLGLEEEGDAAVTWLVGALDADPPLASALDPEGGPPPGAHHLSALPGWRRSQPVWAGSDAPERPSAEPSAAAVAVLAAAAASAVGPAVRSRWDRVVAHADWLADHWGDADAGVWDHRGPARHWTAPRLATRAALVAAAAEARRRHPLDLDAVGWDGGARAVERALLATGVHPTGALRAAPAGELDDQTLDAGLARVAALGPWPADDVVVARTLDRLAGRLADGPWILPWSPEFDDGRAGTEPPSVTATLWVARAEALAGRWDDARERIEAVVALGGPLGLLPESVHPATATALGNRPAAAPLVALIEAVWALRGAPD